MITIYRSGHHVVNIKMRKGELHIRPSAKVLKRIRKDHSKTMARQKCGAYEAAALITNSVFKMLTEGYSEFADLHWDYFKIEVVPHSNDYLAWQFYYEASMTLNIIEHGRTRVFAKDLDGNNILTPKAYLTYALEFAASKERALAKAVLDKRPGVAKWMAKAILTDGNPLDMLPLDGRYGNIYFSNGYENLRVCNNHLSEEGKLVFSDLPFKTQRLIVKWLRRR